MRSVTRPSKNRKGKFSKKGRHHRPSQAQKVALRAGMAAPALAVTGALAAAGPQALAATATAHQVTPTGTPAAAKTTAIHLDAVVQRADHAAVQQADQPTRTYTVRLGNTLAGIAQDFYGHASDWQYLDKINKSQISDPNLIYPGEVLTVPVTRLHR